MAKSRSKKSSKGGKRPQRSRASADQYPALKGKPASKAAPLPKRSRRSSGGAMIFTRQNYILLLLGIIAIVIGYTTMRIENEVDGIISLYIAPLLILGGYLEIIYAILWRPKEKPQADAA